MTSLAISTLSRTSSHSSILHCCLNSSFLYALWHLNENAVSKWKILTDIIKHSTKKYDKSTMFQVGRSASADRRYNTSFPRRCQLKKTAARPVPCQALSSIAFYIHSVGADALPRLGVWSLHRSHALPSKHCRDCAKETNNKKYSRKQACLPVFPVE